MSVIRSWWDHISFRAQFRARLLVDCLLLLTGIGLLFFGGHALPDVVGWTATVAGVLLFAHDLRDKLRQKQRLQVGDNYDYSAQIMACAMPAGTTQGFATLPTPAWPTRVATARPYVTSPAVNALLEGSANALIAVNRRYAMPSRLRDHHLRCVDLKKPDFNQLKVRLCTDPTEALLANGRPISIQQTDYFSGVATNEMACQQFGACTEDRHGRAECLLALSDYVIDSGKLLDLSESLLSNHIGVTTLIVTADDKIVVQTQGDQMVAAHESIAGASGSVDWADIKAIGPQPTLQALLRHAMQREAAEELSARFDGPTARTWLVGYARYLARGGKPEFFGISRTSSSFAELHATPGDRRYVAGIGAREIGPGPSGLRDTLATILQDGDTVQRPYSPSMVVCLRLALAYLDRGGSIGTT